MQWRLVQLADSGFPAGGFAHSGGLEAAVALGRVRGEEGVVAFATATLWQTGTFALAFVRAAHAAATDEERATLDERCEKAQSGHVTRRASRTQGRAWMRACGEAFGVALPTLPVGHLPVAFGVSSRALGIGLDDALALYLQLVVRGVLSAAVRLGQTGPNAAQRMQDGLASVATEVLAACGERGIDAAAHSAPIEELFANLHDTLPARLFQS
jgi:urease accessory protein